MKKTILYGYLQSDFEEGSFELEAFGERHPIRLAAALHYAVLTGQAPDLAPYYPNLGGRFDERCAPFGGRLRGQIKLTPELRFAEPYALDVAGNVAETVAGIEVDTGAPVGTVVVDADADGQAEGRRVDWLAYHGRFFAGALRPYDGVKTDVLRTLTAPIADEDVAARAILGEWLAGSGGGWQDSGGLWPGMKLIQGVPAEPGDVFFIDNSRVHAEALEEGSLEVLGREFAQRARGQRESAYVSDRFVLVASWRRAGGC